RVKNVIIISLSVIFLLASLSVIFIFKNRQKLYSQKQLILSAQLEIAEHSLILSELKLNDFKKRIQEKTKLVENLKKELQNLPNTDRNLLVQLQQSTILTEDDWKRFKSTFEQVHSGFLNRMKEKYPEMSPA